MFPWLLVSPGSPCVFKDAEHPPRSAEGGGSGAEPATDAGDNALDSDGNDDVADGHHSSSPPRSRLLQSGFIPMRKQLRIIHSFVAWNWKATPIVL